MKSRLFEEITSIDCVIDFGTANTVGAYQNPVFKVPMCVPMSDGGYKLSTALYIESDTHYAVGSVAKDQSILEPDKVETDIKRKLGSSEKTTLNGIGFSKEQMAALVMKEAVRSIEQELGKDVKNVLLTVPAAFTPHERKAIICAAEIIGLNVVELLDEPIAAAIGYIETKNQEGTMMFIDIGAGTSDFFALDYHNQKLTPLLKDGISDLGGNNYSNALKEGIKKQIGWKSSEDFRSKQEEQILSGKAEEMKQRLSKLEKDQIVLTAGGQTKLVKVTREEFESWTQAQQDILLNKLEEFKKNLTKVGVKNIDKVVMTGGGGSMPQIKKLAEEVFGVEPVEHDCNYAVAKGAVIYSQDPEKYAIIGKAYGVRVLTMKGEPKINNIIKASDICPVVQKKSYETICDDQERVTLKIYESHAVEQYIKEAEGTFLGNVVLLLPPRLKKGASIEVEFKLDKSGLLSVMAKEKKSGRSVAVSFEPEGVVDFRPVKEQRAEIEKFLKNTEG